MSLRIVNGFVRWSSSMMQCSMSNPSEFSRESLASHWEIESSNLFSYLINRWCGDHQESDLKDPLNTASKASLIQAASTRSLTTFHVTVKSSIRTATIAMLTPAVYIFFAGEHGSSPVIQLNDLSDRPELFQSLEIDEFVFTIPDTGMVRISEVMFSVVSFPPRH